MTARLDGLKQFWGAFRCRTGSLRGEGSSTPLAAPGRAPAWLALHGYCGTPEEMRLVVEVAQSGGFQVEAPVLRGHCTHARDLAPLGFDDWYEGVRTSFLRAAERGPALIVGLSLGSLLGTRLALEFPDRVLGLVLLANAFFLSPFPSWPLRSVDRLGLREFGVPKLGSDIGDADARRTHLSYTVQPVGPAIRLLRAAEQLFGELPRLTCPTLIVHGAKDRLCPVSNAWRVAEQIDSDRTRVVILPRSHHIVTRDFDREQLRTELAQFAARLTPPS
ncbi:MAG TPA: alpha/beta fold hydrolase [Polyangiaceae bacterium]